MITTKQRTATRDYGTVPTPHKLSTDDRAAALLAASLVEVGVGQRQLATRIGASHALIKKWLAGMAGPVRWMLRIQERCPALFGAIVRRLREQHRPVPGLDLLQHAAIVSAECGDVARATHLALLDGRVDDAERRRLVTEIAQAIAALEAMQREAG